MGIWANGPSPIGAPDIPAIAEVMRGSLEQWMTARVQIWDPRRDVAPSSDYDPRADGPRSSTAVLVLDSGANGALIQPIRQSSRLTAGGQPNALVGIRFQIKRSATPEAGQTLRGGLEVRVLDGGNDPMLTSFVFSLGEVVDSSLAWDRIWDATVLTGG